MEKNYTFYKNLIENTCEFKSLWDLVIITSINESQKICYEKQIETKLNNKNLPNQFKYLVINDPNDVKIGSGGSTLNVIKQIYEQFNDELYRMKILLIHAGGYSQRMPSCSILGKIFSSIACESEYINDILDLKLAIYTPFSVHMSPGIFVSSSDDFETFIFDEQIESSKMFGSNNNDFVLIAHKSSLEVGKDHGVYVLDQELNRNSHKFKIFNCKTVLQKPSIEKMKSLDIVLKDRNSEYVYTDSVFYFSHKITQVLLNFYHKYFESIIQYKFEIDAYRDFLQPLGTNQLNFHDYLFTINKNTKNENNSEYEVYKNLYNLFENRNSLILALNDSDFYHLGTVNEMIDFYLNQNSENSIKFRKSLCFKSIKLNPKNKDMNLELKGCIIKSKIGLKCSLNEFSIVEYCFFDDEIKINLKNFCFLNNCKIIQKELKLIDLDNFEFNIPNNICMHTIPVKDMNDCKYITIFFDRNDDLKKVYADLESMKLLGTNFKYSVLNLNFDKQISIWNLKLFKAFDSMSESFFYSLQFVNNYLNDDNEKFVFDYLNENVKFYSLFDILKLQNFELMLKFRAEYGLV